MSKKIYVGNLNYRMRNEGLEELFGQFGPVVSAKIIMDRETNRSKGFGFVEMEDEDSAQAAISALNGTEIEGRSIKVNESIEKERGPRRF